LAHEITDVRIRQSFPVISGEAPTALEHGMSRFR
jgi:hypothetical protein